MRVKKFYGKTPAEALAAVRAEMGPEAVILETRQTRAGLLGAGGRTEILAALEEPAEQGASFAARLESAMAADAPGKPDGTVEAARTGGLAELAATLLQHGMEPVICFEMAERVSHKDARQGLAAVVRSLLSSAARPSYSPGTVLCLVGPTGAGKTTTAAKIAAVAGLKCGLKVLWIAADTYRIGGVEQASTYAEIMRIPLEICSTPAEVKSAIACHPDAEYIIVDTTGRSHLKEEQVASVAEMVRSANPTETHLTIPASSGWLEAQEILAGFGPTSYSRITVTKVDEATRAGTILNLAALAKVPLCYFTTGQVVPDDLSHADPAIVEAIFERRALR